MIAGAVLAGGKSERFGSDKRFFKIGGKTLLEIACGKIRKNFEDRYIVIDKSSSINIYGFKTIYDEVEGLGPMGGIYSLLKVVKRCVFIPVDMPFILDSTLKKLASYKNCDAVYIFSKRIYPLPGYYTSNILQVIENLIKENELSLKALLKRVKNKHRIYVDSRYLLNMNYIK